MRNAKMVMEDLLLLMAVTSSARLSLDGTVSITEIHSIQPNALLLAETVRMFKERGVTMVTLMVSGAKLIVLETQ
jgi:hypothetical protein